MLLGKSDVRQDVSVYWFGVAMEPMPGGYSGETFLVGEPEREVVLRIYRRRPDRALVDASLLRLLEPLLPVPHVIDTQAPSGEHPGIVVTQFVEGVSLDRVLADPPPDLDWEELGLSLGYFLSGLSGIPYLHPGEFVDAELTLSADGWQTDLADFAQQYRDNGRLAAWSERDWQALLALIDLGEDMLDETAERQGSRSVLVHSDFNPKNILVDPSRAAVVAVVDWEFAHAGSVYADFGNFTRFEREGRLVDPLIEAFVEHARGSVRHPFDNGRAADVWALVELAGGVPSNPVRDLASELLLAQARSGDLHAWPFATDRVSPSRVI